ncbi:syntaxin 16 [Angomonas deanei]|uniref:SNARE domain containing protein, putative n=1 Tax=Angomonas deanei TaxID=59799 RepID=A0A7G2CD12_9TRYP|nr:syntaxin 16 [Angomonas deanei]CAD2217710.1 SNARE domain containing protein, putative [Angomonas deanei]|eukprot:EPY26464.1 syntaxin 16 [Angomonas deanei]
MDDDGPPEMRSRFDEFKVFRAKYRPPVKEEETAGGPHESPARQSPWIRAVNDFGELEDIIDRKIDLLAAKQQDFFRPRFLSDEEEAALQDEMETKAVEVQKLLSELDRMVQVSMVPQDRQNMEEIMTSVNARKLLSTRLQALIQRLKSNQEFYGNRLRRRERKQKAFGKVGGDGAYEQIKQEERVAKFMSMGYTDSDIQELLLEETRQDQVSEEIKTILDNVQKLNQMFQDLNLLVTEQGTMLDRIDYNLSQSSQYVSNGVEQLKKAEEHQSSCAVL